MARLTLDNKETMTLRGLIIDAKVASQKRLDLLNTHLDFHKIDSQNSELVKLYESEIELLHKIQGILLKKDSVININGDF